MYDPVAPEAVGQQVGADRGLSSRAHRQRRQKPFLLSHAIRETGWRRGQEVEGGLGSRKDRRRGGQRDGAGHDEHTHSLWGRRHAEGAPRADHRGPLCGSSSPRGGIRAESVGAVRCASEKGAESSRQRQRAFSLTVPSGERDGKPCDADDGRSLWPLQAGVLLASESTDASWVGASLDSTRGAGDCWAMSC